MIHLVDACATAVRTVAAGVAFTLMLCVLTVGMVVSGVFALAMSLRD